MVDHMVAALTRAAKTAKTLFSRQPQGRHFALREETAATLASRRTIGGVALAAVMLIGLVALAGPARPSFGDGLICLPIHKVREGETLTKIARRYDVPVEVIVAVNGNRWSINDPASWDHLMAGEAIFVTKRDCSDRTWDGHIWSDRPEQAAQPAAAPAASSPESIDPAVWRVAEAAYNAGFRGDALVKALAIAGGESNYRPGAAGDKHIMNGKWGHSHGVWQIRTLRDGSDKHRTEEFLSQSVTNQAIAAYHISGGGTNFQPWAAYTGPDARGSDGPWQRYLTTATEAANAVTAAREG